MLIRQPKSSNPASGGKTAISTVSPPPFFHGMRLKSADRRTVMGSVSEDAGQSQALLLGAVDSAVVAGIRMAHDAGGRVVPQNPLDATSSEAHKSELLSLMSISSAVLGLQKK